MKSYMIRIDCIDLFYNKIENDKALDYVTSLDLEIIKWLYSSFGNCFFIEVKGKRIENHEIVTILDTNSEKFEWKHY